MRFDFLSPIETAVERMPEGSADRQRLMLAIGAAKCDAERQVVELPYDGGGAPTAINDEVWDERGNKYWVIAVSVNGYVVAAHGGTPHLLEARRLSHTPPEKADAGKVSSDLMTALQCISNLVGAIEGEPTDDGDGDDDDAIGTAEYLVEVAQSIEDALRATHVADLREAKHGLLS